MRTFVIGDIHGAYKALVQALERSGFDKQKDTLITLGDICDGWRYVYECVEELLTIKNRIDLVGNHDEWFTSWLTSGIHFDNWRQGGSATARSYLRYIPGKEDKIQQKYSGGFIHALNPADIPPLHQYFFKHQWLYHLDKKNRLFVHAGIERDHTLRETKHFNPAAFYWDRKLVRDSYIANNSKHKLKFVELFDKIFVGHTTTNSFPSIKEQSLPLFVGNVIDIDTGAGWEGKLTIMDVDTLEYWQSDLVTDLYPGERGR